MSYSVELLKQADKDFSRLVKNNRKAWLLLTKAVQNLQSIELDKVLENQSVKILFGINKDTKKWLEKKKFLPTLFEYRDFPGSFPVRIVFAVNEKQKYILIIEALHHKDMSQSKFMGSISKRVRNV